MKDEGWIEKKRKGRSERRPSFSSFILHPSSFILHPFLYGPGDPLTSGGGRGADDRGRARCRRWLAGARASRKRSVRVGSRLPNRRGAFRIGRHEESPRAWPRATV